MGRWPVPQEGRAPVLLCLVLTICWAVSRAETYKGIYAVATERIDHMNHQRALRLQRSPPTGSSVCDVLCNCTKEKEIFLNVVCEFTENKEYILDERTTVPTVARTFHVNLGSNSQLLIRGGVFRRLNRISIDGGQSGGRQQIDFGPRAFHDNGAPFPEIDLKHAQRLNIHGNAFQGDFKLNVANVDNVIVQAGAFQNTSFFGNFSAVQNLRFEKDAFSGTKNSQIEIIDSNIGLLERMDASMHEIKLQNCRIDAIRSNTFDVVSIKSIILSNCDINVIETNFTTNKLLSEYLGIVGCRIGTIRPNAIANSGFSSMEISGNKIENIESDAISATAINLSLVNNAIANTGPNWLKVSEWSAVRMTNNSFGNLNTMDVLGSGKTCHFDRNSITHWVDESLAAMGSSCKFQENVFSRGCTCNYEWLTKLAPGREDLRMTSYCQIDNLMHCFNSSTFNAYKFYELVCVESDSLDCAKTRTEKKVEAKFLDPNEFANNREQFEKYIYVLAGIVSIIILLVLFIAVLRMRCRGKPPRTAETGTILQQDQGPMTIGAQTTLPPPSYAATMNKTVNVFSAHDRAIVDLALEKLRRKQPTVFDQVDTYTRKLMTEQLSETEKVLTIGEIVRLLDECENIGDDFLAFTDLLYRHLDETNNASMTTTTEITPNASGDPLYAEPGLMGQPPASSSSIVRNIESETHIYAEPNSAQQPLLKTEYSMPMDRNEHMSNLYADPVKAQNDPSTRLVSPYAIGNQLVSTQGPNLPDVLSRSVAANAVPPSAISQVPKLQTFGKTATSSLDHQQPGTSRSMMPMYSIPQKNNIITTIGSPQRIPLKRDNSSSSSNSSSNHSGGSDITFKIDDIIDYADS